MSFDLDKETKQFLERMKRCRPMLGQKVFDMAMGLSILESSKINLTPTP
jgi:hypothetical protein